jgi:hypothetical protein
MEVIIDFKDNRKRVIRYHVASTWVDDCLFCIRTAYMVVVKYPIADIKRIKEIKDPYPGETPDFNQIKKDFGYDNMD